MIFKRLIVLANASVLSILLAHGVVLARVAERGRIGDARRQIDRTSRPVNRATVIADIKRWAGGAARKLRNALDSALKE